MLRQQLIRSLKRPAYRAALNGSRAFTASAPRPAEVELTIDGQKVSIEAGAALIQACEKAGATIPRYCYHEKLMIAGSCRMCLVEVERAPKPVASCAWPVQPGMVVKTNSPLVHKAREGVMEFLLANHPLDCSICDQGGECDLQDQSMRYGADRGRFHEIGGKRAVEDKNIGPLIKTSMNRCIHCTRCVRFSNDIAGAPEMGSFGRGNDLEIGTYLETALDSELSGNVIDLCPVGALTSKPYAFKARPWELYKTETIDVLDALGSNIRVDSRGLQVMRVLPRLNDDINEEWINDKARFACDALSTQRLVNPLIRVNDQFQPASWEQALVEIGNTYKKLAPKGNEFKVIAGHLVETEALVAMKDLANKLGSDNLGLDQPGGSEPIAHGIDIRSNYAFNSRIYGVEDADAILLIGTNPRHEAAVLNARIRKQWLRSDLEIGFVGEDFESTFEYQKLGGSATDLKSALSGEFGKKLASAKKPMIIVGSAVTEHADAKSFYEQIGAFVEKNKANFLTEEWNGFNILQRAASRTGAYEVGFTVPSPEVAQTKPKFVWLLGADEINEAELPKDAFVVYQGHHGDRGAQLADVVLPGAAYTEKSVTYVNTEGRVQMTRAAVGLPGASREDWKIIRAASEYFGAELPYDNVEQLRDRMVEISPALRRYDLVEDTSVASLSKVQLVDQNKGARASGTPLKKPIEDFYFTDAISRNSPTMARCSAAKAQKNPETNFMAPGYPEPQVGYGPQKAIAAEGDCGESSTLGMPTLALTNFNIVCATLGGFITVFGLVSYLLKEKFYLSEALISLLAGVIFGPHATNLLKPEEYALQDPEVVETITLYFTRLVLGVQLVLAGVQLPSKYLKTEWKSLALLLGPGMMFMWLVTSLLVFAFVPHITFLHALAVGACVTPTDPVLSNSIVKGQFADKNIPKELQKIIVAESGANDGLGYPFLFLPLYLIQHIGYGGQAQDGSARNAVGMWFGETWGYTILLSVVYGATVGWIAKELLHWAEERKYVDRESFLVFAITLALFIVGTVGMVGSDDVLACFIAGNTFTWDDWFRVETMDDSFQPTIDMLLNVSIFIWFGAVCPWSEFYHNSVIPFYRLIFLGILVLLLRRLPVVYALHKWIPQIEQKRQAFYVGFFGPIGVSAIFYLYVSLEFLRKITVDGEIRKDAKYLMDVMNIVIWFLTICSIVIHGLSIPMAKLGFFIPRTLSRALSSQREEDPQPFHLQDNAQDTTTDIELRLRRRRPGWSPNAGDTLPRRVVRIGRSIISSGTSSNDQSKAPSRPLSTAPSLVVAARGDQMASSTVTSDVVVVQPALAVQRTIRFPDDELRAARAE